MTPEPRPGTQGSSCDYAGPLEEKKATVFRAGRGQKVMCGLGAWQLEACCPIKDQGSRFQRVHRRGLPLFNLSCANFQTDGLLLNVSLYLETGIFF